MLRVVEKFVSINGESTHAGELAVFLRFAKCNLCCSYCDTQWANAEHVHYTLHTVEELCAYVAQSGVKNVTLTGGEPLLQEEINDLLTALESMAVRVEIETNGSVAIHPFLGHHNVVFTLDYKLPSSGMESAMLLENYQYLSSDDTVKFVIGSHEDLERAREIIETHSLCQKAHVYFSTVFGAIAPSSIVEYMLVHKLKSVRFQLQMHKFIWNPEKRGV